MRKTNVGFLLAMFLISGISAISYISTQGLIDDSKWVSHTLEVQAKISELSTHLLSAEGYLDEYIDSDAPSNFDHYASHSALVLPQLKDIQALTSDNDIQQERIAELKPLIETKLSQWKRIAFERHASGTKLKRELLRREKPAEVGDQILNILSHMNQFEAKLLKIRNEHTNFTARVTLAVIIFGAGLAILIMAFAIWRVNRDMMLRSKAQEESRADAERAERASRVQSEFLANMSHEIRTPLNGILGITELILDSGLTPAQAKYAQMIQESGSGLLHIINDLLDFSKIDAGKLELESISFDLRELIKTQMDLVSGKARQKNLKLSFHVEPNVPDTLRGDPNRIAQIILNLLGNAIKFTSIGSVSLHVSLEKEAGSEISINFSVTDTGIGISGDVQRKLFKPFTQADGSMARKYGGTGLGLSICKQLAELMNGSIGVKSSEGVGSTFWFTCKLKRQDALEHSLHPSDCAAVSFERNFAQKKTDRQAMVLVVEDNPVNQALVLAQLKKLGYSTHAVCNGKEALEAVTHGKYNMILMDCQMPEMDGFEATLRIRNLELTRGTHTPIIALTANAMREDHARCLEAGMDEFLTKPIKIDDLAKALNRWNTAA